MNLAPGNMNVFATAIGYGGTSTAASRSVQTRRWTFPSRKERCAGDLNSYQVEQLLRKARQEVWSKVFPAINFRRALPPRRRETRRACGGAVRLMRSRSVPHVERHRSDAETSPHIWRNTSGRILRCRLLRSAGYAATVRP